MKKFLNCLIAILGAAVIMPVTGVLIGLIYIVKFFRRCTFKDPFRNSRQHPLNSPDAPRG